MALSPVPLAIGIALPLAYAAFRRFAPRDLAAEAVPDDGRRLPRGAVGACMWGLALILIPGIFFAVYGANRLFAAADHAAVTIYPTSIFWCFLPGFAALSIPWLVTIWGLRHFGYAAQAAEIIAKSNAKMNFNGERIMRWLAWGIVAPIAVVTLAAVPMRLTFSQDAVRFTHFAHLSPEVFPLAEARHAYFVDGYNLKDGTFQPQPNVLIGFADGRHLDTNAMGDGSSPPPPNLVDAILTRTGLPPTHVHTEADIPAGQ